MTSCSVCALVWWWWWWCCGGTGWGEGVSPFVSLLFLLLGLCGPLPRRFQKAGVSFPTQSPVPCFSFHHFPLGLAFRPVLGEMHETPNPFPGLEPLAGMSKQKYV